MCYNCLRGDTMVIINGIRHDTYEVETIFRNFSSTEYENGSIKKIIKGVAPYITFSLPNNITICIETMYSKELLKQTKSNIETDITKYISDILYKDGTDNGWHLIFDGLKSCHITMLDEENCNFNICVNYNNKEIEIEIDSKIKLFNN